MGLYYPKLRHAPSSTFILCFMWAVKALAIFCGRAGSSEPSLLAYNLMNWLHEIKYVNIQFINNALVGVLWGQTDTPRSAQQFVKMFHFEEFDVLDW